MVELGSEDLLVLLLASSTIFKEVRRPLSQGLLPGMDLARVDFKPAGQLCNRVLPLERGQSHFGLEEPRIRALARAAIRVETKAEAKVAIKVVARAVIRVVVKEEARVVVKRK